MLRRLVLALLLALAGTVAPAQQAADTGMQATLVADRVFLNGNSTLTAEGAVEVFYQGTRMTAARIVYDRATDLLTIEGPIAISDGAGTVILASEAEMSRDLRDGVLQSARLVLQDQLQLAATAIRRAEGRITTLDRVVASACEVCPSNPVPLWEIRASRVTHDSETRQLTFDNAQMRIAGVPVLWLPRLRLPDPTVERASGFLTPRFRTTSTLGPGISLPYFVALGDSRDLTVTPYLSTSRTATLGLRYRQAFANGGLTFTGALTDDTLRPGETRGYVIGRGDFVLPRGFQLRFDVQEVSDDAYLSDYAIASDDRLATGVAITRTRANENVELRLYRYRSIRAGEVNDTLPTLVGDLSLERRFGGGVLGGEAGAGLSWHGQRRNSGVDIDLDGDGEADGRDVGRLGATLDWRRNWITGPGIMVSGQAEVAFDVYTISDDASFPSSVVRTSPAAAVELRWPWLRAGANGTTDVIEPVAQLVWSPRDQKRVPNEDSRVVEFDEGNLFSLNRFPGEDAREEGLRLNLGLSWTRASASGWTASVLAGRILRDTDPGQFTTGSGLAGKRSDWLVAATVDLPGGLTFTNRALFDDDLDFSKDELRLGWTNGATTVGASYVWLEADAAESRPLDTNELTFDAGFDIAAGWRGRVDARYDFTADRAARAGLGVAYQTDCATIDLSVARRFTSSSSASPVTDFNLAVVLAGVGNRAEGRAVRRNCGG
jgi:LPS-assembly protein